MTTNTAPDDSVDPTADQQTRRPDELEDWLTDLRVTLGDDPPGWLTPEDDAADPAPGPAAAPPPSEDHAVPDTGKLAHTAGPDGNLKGDPPGPAVGRHRAAG
jgi:hypothetical protein